LALLVLAGYAVATLRGPHGLAALYEKRAQIHALEQSNAEMAKELEHKRDRVRRLENNPAEQELEIRRRFKKAHPSEKIYIIGDPSGKQ